MYLRENPKLMAEVPFAKIRTAARKMMKPKLVEMVKLYHV